MATLGEWVLEVACTQAQALAGPGPAGVPVAVNLSPRQFAHQRVVEMVTRDAAADAAGPDHAGARGDRERAHGPRGGGGREPEHVAGHGRALLHRRLRHRATTRSRISAKMPVDAIKIDQSFVQAIEDEGGSAPIVGAVIALAHSLGLEVVAEGVETDGQLQFLECHGCDQVQGYRFSPPVPATEMATLLRNPARLFTDWHDEVASRADPHVGGVAGPLRGAAGLDPRGRPPAHRGRHGGHRAGAHRPAARRHPGKPQAAHRPAALQAVHRGSDGGRGRSGRDARVPGSRPGGRRRRRRWLVDDDDGLPMSETSAHNSRGSPNPGVATTAVVADHAALDEPLEYQADRTRSEPAARTIISSSTASRSRTPHTAPASPSRRRPSRSPDLDGGTRRHAEGAGVRQRRAVVHPAHHFEDIGWSRDLGGALGDRAGSSRPHRPNEASPLRPPPPRRRARAAATVWSDPPRSWHSTTTTTWAMAATTRLRTRTTTGPPPPRRELGQHHPPVGHPPAQRLLVRRHGASWWCPARPLRARPRGCPGHRRGRRSRCRAPGRTPPPRRTPPARRRCQRHVAPRRGSCPCAHHGHPRATIEHAHVARARTVRREPRDPRPAIAGWGRSQHDDADAGRVCTPAPSPRGALLPPPAIPPGGRRRGRRRRSAARAVRAVAVEKAAQREGAAPNPASTATTPSSGSDAAGRGHRCSPTRRRRSGAQVQCLRRMAPPRRCRTGEIGDGARHPPYAVQAASERHRAQPPLEECARLGRQRAGVSRSPPAISALQRTPTPRPDGAPVAPAAARQPTLHPAARPPGPRRRAARATRPGRSGRAGGRTAAAGNGPAWHRCTGRRRRAAFTARARVHGRHQQEASGQIGRWIAPGGPA